MIGPYKKGGDIEGWLEEFSQLLLASPQFLQLLRGQLRETGSSVQYNVSPEGTPYITITNDAGVAQYAYVADPSTWTVGGSPPS